MEPERDFAAWLDRRDAEALARVFDATGGKLLLLAVHLAGNGHDASDLVQATFVAAMARGAQWDRTRPLWPWLAGILHNELRMARRRGRRRREVDLAAVGDAPAVAVDPGDAVASQEALGAVLAAIDALPLPYRQVLRLRLVHGLAPVEIARSLEVPVGTVRAQLHRGLEQLRSALPAGVGAALTVLFASDGVLLAQVRQRVLELAGGASLAASAAATWTLGGWLAMNGKAVAGVVVAAVVVLCLSFAMGAPASWLGSTREPAPAVVEHAALAPAAVADGAPEPTATERTASDNAAATPFGLVVTVKHPGGTPIAGAEVRAWLAPPGGVLWNRDSSVFGRELVAAGVTGTDGVFRATLDELRVHGRLRLRTSRLWVEARTDDAAPRQEGQGGLDIAASWPVRAEIELRPTRGIRGRVVDAAGAPVPFAHFPAHSHQSDTEGRFFVALDADVANWPSHVFVHSSQHGSASIAVPRSAGSPRTIEMGDVTLEPGAVITGRLVLGDGSPVAGYPVRLEAFDAKVGTDLVTIKRWLMTKEGAEFQCDVPTKGRAVRGDVTNTRADGTFRFAGLDPDGSYLVDVWCVKSFAATARPNGQPFELRADHQLLAIEVVDERGQLVPGAAIHVDCYDPTVTDGRSSSERPGFPATGLVASNWLPCGDDDGRRIVLAPFGSILCVHTADESSEPVALRHEALQGQHRATCRVVLRAETRFGKLHVRAIDEAGAALRFGVSLKSLERDIHRNSLRSILPPEGWTFDLPAGRWQVAAVLGKELLFMPFEGDRAGYARGTQEHVVVVETGRTTELQLVGKPAGLVSFDLHATPPLGDTWRSLRVEEAGREVAVIPIEGEHIRRGTPATRFLTRQSLPPGPHSFALMVDGYQPATCTAEVVADQLTTVRVELFAR